MLDPSDASLAEYLLNFRGIPDSESNPVVEENYNYCEEEPFEFDLNVFDDDHEYQKIFEQPNKRKRTPKSKPKKEKNVEGPQQKTSKDISNKPRAKNEPKAKNAKKLETPKKEQAPKARKSPNTKTKNMGKKKVAKKSIKKPNKSTVTKATNVVLSPSNKRLNNTGLLQVKISDLANLGKVKCENSNEASGNVPLSQAPCPNTPSNRSTKAVPLTDDEGLNYNALMAKLNREKKKQYVEQLESSVEEYKNKNATLERDCSGMKDLVEELRTEISYLKGVLANQSQISALLKNIGNTEGVEFVGKVDGESGKLKRKQDLHQESNRSPKRLKTGKDPKLVQAAGVCLHVKSGKVSLEFCAKCNNASSNGVH